MTAALCALCAGIILDCLIGDPRGWPHLVRLIGALVARLERLLYPSRRKQAAGLALIVLVCAVCAAAPLAVLFAAWRVSPWLYGAVETLLVWQCLAAKSLRVESGAVYAALSKGDVPAARAALSMIVGRDTARLEEAAIARAAVETVAENASDGVIAPLFYIALFGGAGGCLYKAVNTMDSMLGYKNARYIDFGRPAAKLDDAFNFIPSRLCALLLIAAAKLSGFDARNAAHVWRRDRRNHASPNSAQPESAVAGALNIRLGGASTYGGVLHNKPTIGDDTRPIEPMDIRRAHKLLNMTTVLMNTGVILWRLTVMAAIYTATR